jgi:ribosomal protein S16
MLKNRAAAKHTPVFACVLANASRLEQAAGSSIREKRSGRKAGPFYHT